MSPDAPGYWRHETTGLLRVAVEAYLECRPLTAEQIAYIRAYIRQWMAADWRGPGVPALRAAVDGLTSRAAIAGWLDAALEEDIDPL